METAEYSRDAAAGQEVVEDVGKHEQARRVLESARQVAGVGGESEDGVDGDDLDAGGVVQATGADGVEGVVVGGDLAGVAVARRLVDEVAVGVEEPVVDAPAVHADAGDLGVTGGEGAEALPDATFEGGQVPAQDSVDVARGMREAVDHVELEPGAVEPDAGDPAALGAEVDGRDGCSGGCGGPGGPAGLAVPAVMRGGSRSGSGRGPRGPR